MVEEEVRGEQEVTITVPIQIAAKFESTDKKEFDVVVGFVGPRGGAFGQSVKIPIKVAELQDEFTLFKMAISLTETGLATFEECVDVLRKCNGDEGAAVQMLVEKKEKEFNATDAATAEPISTKQ